MVKYVVQLTVSAVKVDEKGVIREYCDHVDTEHLKDRMFETEAEALRFAESLDLSKPFYQFPIL